MRKIPPPIFAIVLSAAALHAPAGRAEWVEWLADAAVVGEFDSNINQSFFTASQLDDFIGKSLLSGGRAYQLDNYSRLYTTLEWNGETHENFQKLNQYNVGGKGVLTHKFGLGQQAPMLRLDVADGEIFSDSQLRSGNQLTAGLRLSFWHGEFQQLYMGYRFDDRNAARANIRRKDYPHSVFDIKGHTVELGSNIAVNGRMQLNLGYNHRWGDIVSNNSESSFSPAVLEQVRSIGDDDALPGWIYRTYGNTDTYNVGLSYALLGGHAATALNYSYIETQALGASYANHKVQFSIHYSY